MESSTAAPAAEATVRKTARKHEIVIVGGGNAGISVAARLCRALGSPDVALVEPSDVHYYQPLWTLVGGGVVPKEKSARREADFVPEEVEWVKDSVTAIDAEANTITLASGDEIEYEFLVIACGIELNWDGVKGMAGAIGRDNVCSNYDYENVEYTWQTIENFKGGTALFTMPPPPIKCAGAPQKIAYLADDAFRKQGVRDKTRIIYASATPGIFAVKEYAATLNKVIERKGIETLYQHELIELRPESHEAVFINRADDEEVTIKYDMIHVAPPQRAPQIVRDSALAGEGGWAEVDKHTLRSPRFPNVFAIGDASSLPTSKTGAAIRKQAPVLVNNLIAAISGQGDEESYDGYTACPLVTGYGKLVMAEFDYDLTPTPTFPFDQTKERRSMYELKRRGLPALYWRRILRGKS